MKSDLKKILIIQTAFLGDVVLATPVIEKLHKFYPEASLDFLVRKGNESLLTGHPYLRKLLIFNKKEKIKSLREIISQIRREKYDLVINIQRFFTSGLITVLSGGKRTVGFRKNPLSFLFSRSVSHLIGTASPYRHEVERNLDLISDITDKEIVRPKLYPSQKDFDTIQQYKEGEYITIAPTSVWFTKQFPKEKWVEFIDRLPPDLTVYLLGAPSDREQCESIITQSCNRKVKNLAGKISLLESSALMRDAVINYVNDSAPMHLASQINAPVCAVYCSTVPEFGFGPLSDFSRIVQISHPLYCRPCNLHGYKACPQGHFRCAMNIEVQKLLDVLFERQAEKRI